MGNVQEKAVESQEVGGKSWKEGYMRVRVSEHQQISERIIKCFSRRCVMTKTREQIVVLEKAAKRGSSNRQIWGEEDMEWTAQTQWIAECIHWESGRSRVSEFERVMESSLMKREEEIKALHRTKCCKVTGMNGFEDECLKKGGDFVAG